MGCSPGDGDCFPDETPRNVLISSGYWIGQTAVTQKSFEAVMNDNPSFSRGGNLPVESISWETATEFCRRVNARLPSEAEWEYAARAGSVAARYGDIDEITWYWENSWVENIADNTAASTLQPVARKRPNALGLYDALGNVWELTADWYARGLRRQVSSVDRNPTGPDSGPGRVIRGGSYISRARDIRVSRRSYVDRGQAGSDFGFRCVLL